MGNLNRLASLDDAVTRSLLGDAGPLVTYDNIDRWCLTTGCSAHFGVRGTQLIAATSTPLPGAAPFPAPTGVLGNDRTFFWIDLLDFGRAPPVHYDEHCGAREHGIAPIQVVNPSAVPRDR